MRIPLPELHFYNPRLAKVGVDILTLTELRSRASRCQLTSPQRVDFHHVLLVEQGRAKHMVDFVEHDLGPGSVLLVRPGQVQQWRMSNGFDGQLVLVSSEALAPSRPATTIDIDFVAFYNWRTVSRASGALFAEAVSDSRRLRSDINRFRATEIETAIIRHELLVLLLRLSQELSSRLPTRDSTRRIDIYRRFATEVEASFRTRPSVLDCAHRIGVSESTLSRACVAVVGHTAKDEIDRRVALEAKRLLVYTTATAAEIGNQLGFSEATNFLKFFKRLADRTPTEFRAAHG